MNEIRGLYVLLSQIPIASEHRHLLLAAIDRLKAKQDTRNKILEAIKESLADLRLDMKYLAFDLECTRRERDEALK